MPAKRRESAKSLTQKTILNYSLVWSQTMAKDMRPQRVAISSRLSIEILLYVAETRQKGFGSIASLFQAIFSPLFSFRLPFLSQAFQ